MPEDKILSHPREAVGKTVAGFAYNIDDRTGEELLILHFTDGSEIRIKEDHDE